MAGKPILGPSAHVLFHIEPEQIEVAFMPILSVEEFAAKHLWPCDFEHTVRRQFALNCAGLGRPEIGQHGAQMRLKRTPPLRPVPRDGVDAQRGGMARLKFAAQP